MLDEFDRLPEFFGQRPWRTAGQNLETTDPAKEREGIAALQAKEALVDHSVSSSDIKAFIIFKGLSLCPSPDRQLPIFYPQTLP